MHAGLRRSIDLIHCESVCPLPDKKERAHMRRHILKVGWIWS